MILRWKLAVLFLLLPKLMPFIIFMTIHLIPITTVPSIHDHRILYRYSKYVLDPQCIVFDVPLSPFSRILAYWLTDSKRTSPKIEDARYRSSDIAS